MMSKIISSLIILLIVFAPSLFSQEVQSFSANEDTSVTTSSIEMADYLRSSGKIYVVVAVLVTIFIGILLYLFYIERKLSRIEQQHKNKND